MVRQAHHERMKKDFAQAVAPQNVAMLVRVHSRTAQEFLAASDREFAAGDALQASEKLWGAAAHAIMAVAQQQGL